MAFARRRTTAIPSVFPVRTATDRGVRRRCGGLDAPVAGPARRAGSTSDGHRDAPAARLAARPLQPAFVCGTPGRRDGGARYVAADRAR